jgi:tetratricopeptide (TPR) repeat protein
MTVEKKLKNMLEMTRNEDFGELTEELEALHNMIINMQKAMLEPLLESVETIERRMFTYVENKNRSTDSLPDADTVDEEGELSKSQAAFKYDPTDAVDAREEMDEEAKQTVKVEKKSKSPKPATDDLYGEFDATAMQNRFFERLGHFFELQGLSDQRAALVDPQGKIAGIKVKSHSKGIQEKDGTFKAGYRQQDLTGNPVKHLTDLYKAAEVALPEFKATLRALIDAVGGLEESDLEIAEIKSRDRATEKAQEEYSYRIPGPPESWLYDILRASVVCKTYKQMSEVNKWLKENIHIVEGENRFAMPQFDGYRDLLYYVSVPYNNDLAFVCEIQVHHREFRQHFGLSSHKAYFRPYFAGPFRDDVDVLRDLDMLLQLGGVDDQLMEFLLESTDASQLKLFGRLFHEKLEETDKALELFKRVLTMEESSFGKGNVITGTTYQYIGLTLLKKGDPDGALLYLREGLSVMETNLGLKHPEIAQILSHIGQALSTKGEYDSALVEYQKSLSIRVDTLGEDHVLVAKSYLAVAQTLCEKGEYDKGLAECRAALKIQESTFGADDENVSQSRTLIGDILREKGEYDEAIKSYETVLAIREEALGRKHPRVADTLSDIGVIKSKQGKLDDAESYHRRALGIRELKFGNDHADCAISYSNLGIVLQQRGDLEGALTAFRLALSIRTKTFGRMHYMTSVSFYELGSLLAAKDSYDHALTHYKECLAIRKQLYGRNHPRTALVTNALGRLRTSMGDAAGAFAEHRKALGVQEKLLGAYHPEVANTHQYIAEAYIAASEKSKALEHQRKALAIRTIALSNHHPDVKSSYLLVGALLDDTGDLKGAKETFSQLVNFDASRLGEEHVETATSRIKYAQSLRKCCEYDKAETECRKALEVIEGSVGIDDLTKADGLSCLGNILNCKGEYAESIQWHEKALRIRIQKLGEGHPDVTSSRNHIQASTEGRPVNDKLQ